ncbi:peptidoglycan bridge formation glycyltransferase FemA/FemB family protein [Candidatus Saccharibacteria bacterium]|nr:peptidoglycan bridge formation glycyltransferase FemA/FemB family protein [Candidatus Saccharibacteria bacterium]
MIKLLPFQNYDHRLKNQHFQQLFTWAEFKHSTGWKPFYLEFDRLPILVLSKDLPMIGTVFQIPKGPVIKPDQYGIFDQQVRDYIRTNYKHPAILRVDPHVLESDFGAPEDWQKENTHMQFSSTVLLDTTNSLDALLSSFKQKTRYNIRLAGKRGVEIVNSQKSQIPIRESIDALYALMAVTQSRAGYFLRPKAYFANYWNRYHQAEQGTFIFAKYQGQIIAGGFFIYHDKLGYYKDGGSNGHHRSSMAPYLLQWEAISYLRSQGVEKYDFVGAPHSSQLDNNHPFESIYKFKSMFNPKITDYAGIYNVPLCPDRYNRYQKYFKYYNSIYIRAKKDIFY